MATSRPTDFDPANVVVDIALCSLVSATAVHYARNFAYAHDFRARFGTPVRGQVRAAIHQALAADWIVRLPIRGELVEQGCVTNLPVEITVEVPLAKLLSDRRILISDNFSVSQLERIPASLEIRHVCSPATEPGLMQAQSIIKDIGLSRIVADVLGRSPEHSKDKVLLSGGDVLYIARIVGGFLPKKAKTLPPGLKLEFIKLSVMGVNLYRHTPSHT